MKQSRYKSDGLGASQSKCILRRLKRHRGKWVSLQTLWRASGSMAVHSRIAELRDRGEVIESRCQRFRRMVLSSYRVPK